MLFWIISEHIYNFGLGRHHILSSRKIVKQFGRFENFKNSIFLIILLNSTRCLEYSPQSFKTIKVQVQEIQSLEVRGRKNLIVFFLKTLFLKVDVISQKLMIRSCSKFAHYKIRLTRAWTKEFLFFLYQLLQGSAWCKLYQK